MKSILLWKIIIYEYTIVILSVRLLLSLIAMNSVTKGYLISKL